MEARCKRCKCGWLERVGGGGAVMLHDVTAVHARIRGCMLEWVGAVAGIAGGVGQIRDGGRREK